MLSLANAGDSILISAIYINITYVGEDLHRHSLLSNPIDLSIKIFENILQSSKANNNHTIYA
jgi:hypothetical protein